MASHRRRQVLPASDPPCVCELIWNLALAGALVWLGRRRQIRAPGLFALDVAGYPGFRILEELLRVDPAHHIMGLRLIFFVAAILCATALPWFAHIRRGSRARRPVSSPVQRRSASRG